MNLSKNKTGIFIPLSELPIRKSSFVDFMKVNGYNFSEIGAFEN